MEFSYVLVEGEQNGLFCISIERITNLEEAILHLDNIDYSEGYMGFQKANSFEVFTLIVTDNKQLICKYRDVFSYQDFIGAFYAKYANSSDPLSDNGPNEIINHFNLVWRRKLAFAFQRPESYNYYDPSTGELFLSEGYHLVWAIGE